MDTSISRPAEDSTVSMRPYYEHEGVSIYHGDCLEVMRSLAGTIEASAVVTDPPYCSGAATEAGRGSATHQGLRSESIRKGRFEWFNADNMTTSGLVWLLRELAVQSSRLIAPDGSLLAFCDWRMAFAVGPAMESAGFRLRNLLVWDKGNFGCGTGFRPQHELVLHLTRRAPTFHAMDVGNVLSGSRVPSKDRLHPAEKPVDVLARMIGVVSPAGALVVDPFMGSGATGAACLKVDRRFIGIEVDEAHCEAAAKRFDRAYLRGGFTRPSLFDMDAAS